MGLPSKRRTRTSRDDRRSHHALKAVSANTCPSCGATVRPHYACTACGKYQGKTIINVDKRKARLARHQKPLS